MLEKRVITRSCSDWASPIVLVDKPDGGTRFCVDYRKLNAVTKKDRFPHPRVHTSLEWMGNRTEYMSKVVCQVSFLGYKSQTRGLKQKGIHHQRRLV